VVALNPPSKKEHRLAKKKDLELLFSLPRGREKETLLSSISAIRRVESPREGKKNLPRLEKSVGGPSSKEINH